MTLSLVAFFEAAASCFGSGGRYLGGFIVAGVGNFCKRKKTKFVRESDYSPTAALFMQ